MSPGHIDEPIQPPPDCTGFTRELLSRVGDKWSLLIIGHLSNGPLRLNELRRTIEVSQRMLTLTLKSLEKDGLITRTQFPTIPPRVDYELTALGRTLLEPVMGLVLWANRHKAEVELARARFEANAAQG